MDDDLEREDINFLVGAVNNNPRLLKYFLKSTNSREMALAAIENDGHALEFAEEFRSDREIVLAALKTCPVALQYACDELRNDRDIVKISVKSCGESINYASLSLKSDYELVLIAAVQNPRTVLTLDELNFNALELYTIDYLNKYSISIYSFYSSVLFAIFRPNPLKMHGFNRNNKTSKISTLLYSLNELGSEACFEFKKNLAGYIGVRLGDQTWWNGVELLLEILQTRKT
mmetsp:Transcript_47405/g.60884  ORF Transcript_47405/g.60884 Transcript_47405/m.60884 type:complete len:231 (-) Transcript_47405:73-765(-)